MTRSFRSGVAAKHLLLVAVFTAACSDAAVEPRAHTSQVRSSPARAAAETEAQLIVAAMRERLGERAAAVTLGVLNEGRTHDHATAVVLSEAGPTQYLDMERSSDGWRVARSYTKPSIVPPTGDAATYYYTPPIGNTSRGDFYHKNYYGSYYVDLADGYYSQEFNGQGSSWYTTNFFIYYGNFSDDRVTTSPSAQKPGNDFIWRFEFANWTYYLRDLSICAYPYISQTSSQPSATFYIDGGTYCKGYANRVVVYYWITYQGEACAISAMMLSPINVTSYGTAGLYVYDVNTAASSNKAPYHCGDGTNSFEWWRNDGNGNYSVCGNSPSCSVPVNPGDQTFDMVMRVTRTYIHGVTKSYTMVRTVPVNITPPLAAYINGPDYVGRMTPCTWTGSAANGQPPYMYQWSGVVQGSGETLQAKARQTGDIVLTVTDANGATAETRRWVTVGDEAGICG